MPNFNNFGCGNDKCEKRFKCNKFVNSDDEKYQVLKNLEDVCSNYNYEYFEEITSKNNDTEKIKNIINKRYNMYKKLGEL